MTAAGAAPAAFAGATFAAAGAAADAASASDPRRAPARFEEACWSRHPRDRRTCWPRHTLHEPLQPFPYITSQIEKPSVEIELSVVTLLRRVRFDDDGCSVLEHAFDARSGRMRRRGNQGDHFALDLHELCRSVFFPSNVTQSLPRRMASRASRSASFFLMA